MNARQDDKKILKHPVPEDVGESAQQSAARAAVPIGVCKRIVRNPGHNGVDGFAEFMTETRSLSLVPVLDSRQVELGRSTDENR